MSYIDVLRDAPQVTTPGTSACQGCGAELILRKVMQIAGPNTIYAVPPGCMAGAGIIGWREQNGCKAPIHITLLDNTAAFMSGVTQYYQRKGREDVNMVCLAGDGATADCGFQSMSGAAERGEHMLYICYDNEGYMNTGYQRSSTTSLGSKTSTTPTGSVINGKQQNSKYLPLIMALHNVEYCATASPSNMADFVKKIQKGLEASKKGFAYIHVFSPCPTGWAFKGDQGIRVADRAVKSNMFPLWECDKGEFKLNYKNDNPISIKEFVAGIGKFKKLTDEDCEMLEACAKNRYEQVKKLCEA